ncbi:hypothetical protein QVN42_02770 [Yersinia nurmii]|uniref:Lipoprotein n=1 Tax=Yersinia nurmii TaxID=685706 RepID=A0AAW7K2H3_9GAMM|nr:hypothetical protein [Yersinia nurmii]MDN0086324.1 hypothetical protein [Yersinia nurmii]
MRWLFILLIAVSCWTGSVASKPLLAGHSDSTQDVSYRALQRTAIQYINVEFITQNVFRHGAPQPDQLRLGKRIKNFSIKNRLGTSKFTGTGNTLWVNLSWHPSWFLTSRNAQAKEIYKQSRQPSPLRQSGRWMLHSAAQQNRVGGWKESNILYSGALTYHDAATLFPLS